MIVQENIVSIESFSLLQGCDPYVGPISGAQTYVRGELLS